MIEPEGSVELALQPKVGGSQPHVVAQVLVRSAASSLILNDAFVGLAQPLTEAFNQLASGWRRANDLIEELGRAEEFRLDIAGGANSRTARLVFDDTHLSDKLSGADRAEQNQVAIEFSDHLDSTS